MVRTKTIQHVNEERGMILVIAVLVMAVLLILGLALLSTSRNEDAIAANYRYQTQAFYAAEAGIESALLDLNDLLAATETPTDAQLAALAPPTLTNTNYSFDTFQVGRVRVTPPYHYTATVDGGAYDGMVVHVTDYAITAEVIGPRGSRAQLTQTLQKIETPLFQFAAFYGRGVDLEISPGPPMTFTGRVHANSDIYAVDHGSGVGLYFDSPITAVGEIYHHKKIDPSDTGNGAHPQIKDTSGNYQEFDFDHEYQPGLSSPWATENDFKLHTLSTYGGTVKDSAMAVQEILPPVPDALYDPVNPTTSSHQLIEAGDVSDSAELQAAKMYYKADLKIHTDSSGNVTATDKSGNLVDLSGCNVSTPSFYNMREEATVTVTEVDVAALQACGRMPANGVLYVHNTVNAGDHKGVRLVNGSTLPTKGLTVVSENPIYVQGDYNTVNKQPAAVMGDAVTILSNNWGPNNSDSKGDQVTSNRPATDTTVNAAFMLGPNREAEEGSYNNGAIENVIRFLENWKDKNMTYNGAIVALWHSQQAMGDHRCCGDDDNNYYRAPIRNWSYDTLFDTQLPPGAPKGVISVTKGRWSQE